MCKCINCGKEIEDGEARIVVKDNYLIVKYFEEKPVFCSKECLMTFISADTEYED